jgi:hypothetical protein
VHPRQAVPDTLIRLARLQAGALSREQIRAHGLSDDVLQRLASDQWQRLGRGVYFTANSTPPWEAIAWGGVLAGGDRARLGPRASGWLHRLVEVPPRPVDVLVPHARGSRPTDLWAFQRERPGARSGRTQGSPPRLGAEDTILDLAAGAECEADIISALAVAAQRRITTPDRLLLALECRRRQPHRALLRAALGDVAEGAQSVLEVRYLRCVERAHGLPRGRRQHRLVGLRHRIDVEYEECALLVEVDGAIFHDGEARFRDLDRDNVHALRNRLTLRYGWFDLVDHPCRVAAQVAGVLTLRGWTGVPSRCHLCRRLAPQDWEWLSGVVA